MYTQKFLQQKISNITIWRKGDNRAPHKPLLLLLALSEYRKGHPRLFNYGNEIHQQLLELLMNFGPSRREHYPNMPFWRLARDGFWELQLPKESDLSKENKQPSKNKLIQQNVLGGFDQESYQLLIKKPSLINKLAQQILSEHFPDNVQEIIANRLDFPLQEIRQNRDPTFRKNILRAYNYQCAICGYVDIPRNRTIHIFSQDLKKYMELKQVYLQNDQFVDMKFTTCLTGLTDK